ncbi:haloacid dehalogenase type II [Pseudoduganella sp. RAF53_2]|uniref:haloacid dehalogenase type II n=1 Tax=unclassified Pseudoduganella TaxID=2637179 RepID=UPI003F9D9000
MEQIKAIAFDLYGTLFDVYSVAKQCEDQFPGRGAEVSMLWRQKQLEYTWLRSLMNRYEPFERVTHDALQFTCRHLGLNLDAGAAEVLEEAYLALPAFREVPETLRELRRRGLRLAILSNGTPNSIGSVVRNAGLQDAFDFLLSVEEAGIYKPSSRAYVLAEQAFELPKSSILFVSSNGWDVTGARAYGFPACWINRGGNVFEEMGQQPDRQLSRLDGLLALFPLKGQVD